MPEQTRQEQLGKRKARRAGLHYIHNLENGWLRRRCGSGFTYYSARGQRIVGKRSLERIAALAIPPAWEDVRICPSASGHLQAIGRDGKGRQQYLYHDDWHAISAATKFDRLERIGNLLPKIRRRVRRDLAGQGLTRERVVAAIIRLIDKSHLRVGSPVYAGENGSHGATTLTAEHVEIDDFTISLDYPAKSGRRTEGLLTDRKVAAVIQQCEEINGQFLFCYRDDNGSYSSVSSSDVNSYLQEVAEEELTAKDFRTWTASVLALRHLKPSLEKRAGRLTKRSVTNAIRETAKEMGHTNTVCRQSYIHPGLLAACETNRLSDLLRKHGESVIHKELTRDENQFLAILPALTR